MKPEYAIETLLSREERHELSASDSIEGRVTIMKDNHRLYHYIVSKMSNEDIDFIEFVNTTEEYRTELYDRFEYYKACAIDIGLGLMTMDDIIKYENATEEYRQQMLGVKVFYDLVSDDDEGREKIEEAFHRVFPELRGKV